jgi:hypothetical protein
MNNYLPGPSRPTQHLRLRLSIPLKRLSIHFQQHWNRITGRESAYLRHRLYSAQRNAHTTIANLTSDNAYLRTLISDAYQTCELCCTLRRERDEPIPNNCCPRVNLQKALEPATPE